jgi:hypothetical protein
VPTIEGHLVPTTMEAVLVVMLTLLGIAALHASLFVLLVKLLNLVLKVFLKLLLQNRRMKVDS